MRTVGRARILITRSLFAAVMHVPMAWAQSSATVVGTWLVTVEGESRQRVLRVTGSIPGADGDSILEASYGFVDGKASQVSPRLNQKGAERILTFVTGADSQVATAQKSDGMFAGTITYKNGQTKKVSIERATETGHREVAKPSR